MYGWRELLRLLLLDRFLEHAYVMAPALQGVVAVRYFSSATDHRSAHGENTLRVTQQNRANCDGSSIAFHG